jgi:hypothetical protein
MTSPYKLYYQSVESVSRMASLELLKTAMVEAIVSEPEIAIDASGVAIVDGPLIQFITAIAFACQKLSLPFAVIDPPIDLVLGFDRLGIDWRGLNIAFRESEPA